MRRREFITLLGSAAAWVSPARAQEPRRVIGVLSSFGFSGFFAEVTMPSFSQGLKDVGFFEGRNISIEIRQADGHYDRLPSLAAELVGRNVAAIYATDVPSAFAAKAGVNGGRDDILTSTSLEEAADARPLLCSRVPREAAGGRRHSRLRLEILARIHPPGAGNNKA